MSGKLYYISMVSNYNYTQEFTGVVLKNYPNRILININGEDMKREILKEKIILFEPLK